MSTKAWTTKPRNGDPRVVTELMRFGIRTAAERAKIPPRLCPIRCTLRPVSKKVRVKWFAAPQSHDYPAAESYLSLLFEEETAARFVKQLHHARVKEFKAKDIFRASGHSLRPRTFDFPIH